MGDRDRRPAIGGIGGFGIGVRRIRVSGNVLFGGSGDRGLGYLDDREIWISKVGGLGIEGSGISRSGIEDRG